MNAVLNKSAKQVKTLSARANKGTIKSLYLQIEMGKICSTAHAYWKANKKELGITRDELTILHGFKSNTFFGELRSASNIPIEDTEKYIQSLGDEPTASIKGLLAFVKPAPPEKVPNMFSFSQAKTDDEKGLSARVDVDLKLKTNSDLNELLDAMNCMTKVVEAMLEEKQLANIELVELIEA
tara:strand:+ start:487 stop:1032 length:546 start_codon:yes stop_codon:yes gene_type:complete